MRILTWIGMLAALWLCDCGKMAYEQLSQTNGTTTEQQERESPQSDDEPTEQVPPEGEAGDDVPSEPDTFEPATDPAADESDDGA